MIKTSVRGIEELKALFKRVPVEIRKGAVEEATKYLIGAPGYRHGLGHYPPPFVGSKRTFKLQRSWQSKKQGGGYGATLYNDATSKYGNQYAKWVQGDGTQARHVRARGWRVVSEIISTNIKGMMQAVNQFVARWIKANNR